MEHSEAKVWSLLTNWDLSNGAPFAYPVDLRHFGTNIRTDVPIFNGTLAICDRPYCDPNKEQWAFDTFAEFLADIEGTGQVLRYDPVVGDFAGWVKFKDFEHGQIEIDIDVQWDPLPDAGLWYPPDAGAQRSGDAAAASQP
jgi:hypothetical protein